MADLMYVAALSVVAVIILCAGIEYCRFIREATKERTGKQTFVKQNLESFGVRDGDVSVDERQVFTVNPSDLGI